MNAKHQPRFLLCIFWLLAWLIISQSSMAQIRINSLNREGQITWTGVAAGEDICLQWASSITGPWQSALNGQPLFLDSTRGSGVVPAAIIPAYYRIRKESASPIVGVLSQSYATNWAPGIVHFYPPSGDGRRDGGGAMIFGDSAFEAFGSSWEFDYEGNDFAAGVQVVHPFQGGQVVVRIRLNTLLVSTPRRWIEIGYGVGGGIDGVIRTSAYTNIFPLKTGTMYHIKTTVSPAGDLSVAVNQSLLASVTIRTAHSMDFTVREFESFPSRSSWDLVPFRGAGFPVQWQKGYTGLILEPTERGGGLFNVVLNLRYVPGF